MRVQEKPVSRKKWIIIGLLLVAGGIYWSQHDGKKDDQKGGKPPVSVTVAEVKTQNVPIQIREVGTVVVYESVAVKARLDSQLMEVLVKDGQHVNQGDLMFVLDDRILNALMKQQQANLLRDRAQMENARVQLERIQKLSKNGFATQAALDQSKATFETQKAAAASSEAAIEDVRTQLQYTRITAPISGRIGTINVTRGNNVRINDTQPMVTINQLSPIRVQTAVAQRYFDAVRGAMQQGGVQAVVSRDGQPDIGGGTVEYIDNTVDSTTGTFVLRARFENSDEKLWPGMFVNITLRLGENKGALVVPQTAIQQGQEGEYVFVIKDCKSTKRNVKVARTENETAVIAEGLQLGEKVATDGMMSLGDDSKVIIPNDKTCAAPSGDKAKK